MFTPRPSNPPLAAALITTAVVFSSLATLFAKALGTGLWGDISLGDPLSAFQISHGRFLFAFLGIASVSALLGVRPRAVHWRLHLGRTGCGWMGVTLLFASVAYIPITDATAIAFLNPVFCMIFAIPLLGERVGPWRWSAAAIALTGALILLRPAPESFQPAALLALGAALVMGMELILIKKLSGREPPVQILLVNNTIGVCIASVAVLPVWQMPNAAQWAGLAAVGFSMAGAQICFVNAMARGDASFVAPFGYAALVFAALWDALIFGLLPDMVSLTGAAVILTGAALLAWRESRLIGNA